MTDPIRVPRQAWLVDLTLLAVAAVWGSSYLATKDLVTPSTIIAILVLRFAIALFTMAAMIGPKVRRLTASEVRIGILLGAILCAIFVLETVGVTKTSATNAGLIISLTIVITPLVERVVSRRRLPPAFYAATVTAVGGVALLTQSDGFSYPSLGDFLMLIAATVRAVHVVVIHRTSSAKSLDSGRLTLVQLATVTAAFLLMSPFIGTGLATTVHRLDAPKWTTLIYLAVACTVFAFFVQMWAVRRTSPSRVSVLLGTEPVWAAVIGITLAGNRLTIVGFVGGALVLIGINWGRRLEQRTRTQTSFPATSPGLL